MKLSKLAPQKNTAQAIVEFAIVLPILLLLLYGLLEAGRLLFMYSTVVTASRQAARYGSATGQGGDYTAEGGPDNSTLQRFEDCYGIKRAAQRVDFLNAFDDDDIYITYDDGPGTGGLDPLITPPASSVPPWKEICDGTGDPDIDQSISGNSTRIVVTIGGDFNPIVPRIVPFIARTRAGSDPIRAVSARTIITGVSIEVTPPPGSGGGGGGSGLSLSISPTPSTYTAAGEQIDYRFTLTNNDATTPIDGPFTISGAPFTVTCPGGPLAGGASVDCTIVSYFTTAADVTAGFFEFTATASGSGGVTSNPVTSRITLLIASPGLTLSTTPDPGAYLNVGDVITYRYTVVNGSTQVDGLTITDNKVSGITCVLTTLPPSTSTICQGTYSVIQADIDAGSIVNTATASASDGTSSGPATGVAILANPSLSLTKTVSPQTSMVGRTVTYSFTLTNSGNVALSGVSVSDPLLGGAVAGCSSASLAAGGQITCAANYVVRSQDVDVANNRIINTATASGTFGSATPQAQATVTLNVLNETLFLEVSVTPTSITQPGQTITYTYTLTNGTAQNLFNPYTMTGSLPSALNNCFSGTLSANASQSCTQAYPVSQAEFDAGLPIQNNNITVVACRQSGQSCQAANQVTSNTVSATPVTISGQSAALSLEVTVSPAVATNLNQQITYSYRLTNSGNISLKQPFTVTDAKVGEIICTNTADILPGATRVCTKTYNITQADLDAGEVATRQAMATATYGSQTVSANAPVPAVTTYQGGRLKLEILANPTTYPAPPASQPIIYTYRITNTGSVPLSPNPLYLTTSQQSDGRTLTVSCPNTPLAENGDSLDCTATDTLSGPPGSYFLNTATARASDGTTTITSNTATVTVFNPVLCSTTPVTITVSAEADSWVDINNTSATHGSDTILRVQSRNNRDNRSLIRFTLPGMAPGCVIQSATLRLFASSTSSNSRTLQVLPVSASWQEGAVNWSNQPSTTGAAATTASGSDNTWHQWTVTTAVQAMYSGSNNGFLIRDATEDAGGSGHLQEFNSRENGANQPQLVITFVQGP